MNNNTVCQTTDELYNQEEREQEEPAGLLDTVQPTKVYHTPSGSSHIESASPGCHSLKTQGHLTSITEYSC